MRTEKTEHTTCCTFTCFFICVLFPLHNSRVVPHRHPQTRAPLPPLFIFSSRTACSRLWPHRGVCVSVYVSELGWLKIVRPVPRDVVQDNCLTGAVSGCVSSNAYLPARSSPFALRERGQAPPPPPSQQPHVLHRWCVVWLDTRSKQRSLSVPCL